MKLRLSCWAENVRAKAAFAVVTALHADSRPSVVGKTESLHIPRGQGETADFAKTFLIDYELGQEDSPIVVSLYDGKSLIASALFDLDRVLGMSGVLAKQLSSGVTIAVRLEAVTLPGQLVFQLRGLGLKNVDGIGFCVNLSDPYVEIQRSRGQGVWDTVYRSVVLNNTLNPVFPEETVDVDCIGEDTLRVVVYDADPNGKRKLIGSVQLTLKEIVDNVSETPDKAFIIKNGSEQTGKILFTKAKLIGLPEEPAEKRGQVAAVFESEEEILVEPDDDEIDASFADYITGGCEFRVFVAVDSTASNGNPREETSLHFFNDKGPNHYEQAMGSICATLAKFDSDQIYPIFGFGAKKEGVINHCIPFGTAEGVGGIVQIYRDTFRSGIAMSSPRDFSAVIRKVGEEAKKNVDGQSYSILLLFTNGSPEDADATTAALQEIEDAPLSVVIVGVGKGGDFAGVARLETAFPDKVRFVPYLTNQILLTKEALKSIPRQLETFFHRQKVSPQEAPEEVPVVVATEDEEVEVPMEFNEQGEATVTEDVRPPPKKAGFDDMIKFGKDFHKKIMKNKPVGRFVRKHGKQAKQKAKQYLNKVFGAKVL